MARSTGVRQRCAPECPARCRVHRWEFQVELPAGEDGKRRQVGRGGFLTSREASEARAEVLARHKAGTLPNREQGRETVRAYLERWYAVKLDSGALRASTARSYRGHLDRYLLPHLGHLRLTDLRASHVEGMFREVRKATADNPRPVGPTTERRILATLRSAMGEAVKRGHLTHDHTAHVSVRKAERTRARPWTPEVFWGFVERMSAEPAESAGARLLPVVQVATGTGLRLGELLGLRWEDVDVDRGLLVVRQQAQQVGQELTYGKPKTRTGEDRMVPLVGWVPEVLQAIREQQDAQRQAWGEAWQETGLVFTAQDGAGLLPQSVSKAFARLVVAYKLPPLTFHGLRHTCASVLLQAGVPMPVVSRMLGHSSIGITVDTYGHLVMDATTADVIGRALDGFAARGSAIPGKSPGVRRLAPVSDLPA